MFKLIITLHNKERALKFYKHFKSIPVSSNVEYEVFWVYSNNNPDEEVKLVFKEENLLIRENVGRDYGAFYFAAKMDNSKFNYLGFLHDDLTFVKANWLDEIYKTFLLDKAIGIVSPQISINLKGEKIPRGSLWFATKEFIEVLKWPKPLTSKDAYDQEMNLLPSEIKKYKVKIAQCGCGYDIMYPEHYGPDRPETIANKTRIFS